MRTVRYFLYNLSSLKYGGTVTEDVLRQLLISLTIRMALLLGVMPLESQLLHRKGLDSGDEFITFSLAQFL